MIPDAVAFSAFGGSPELYGATCGIELVQSSRFDCAYPDTIDHFETEEACKL